MTGNRSADLIAILGHVVPADVARQVTAEQMAAETLSGLGKGALRILDLGCGDGRAIDWIRKICPDAKYTGLDISDSPEVRSRTRHDAEFVTYDGTNIPFDDGHFDMVFSKQVFEHVRHPDQVLNDVNRVLKPGGLLVASLSFLEPYHSFSIFGYSPFGMVRLIADARLTPLWLRPGIDGLTLTARHVFATRLLDRYFERTSPLNSLIMRSGRLKKQSVQRINARMLSICGHLVAGAQKPVA